MAYYGYVPPQRVFVLNHFSLKMGLVLLPGLNRLFRELEEC